MVLSEKIPSQKGAESSVGHSHQFNQGNRSGERRTLWAVIITLVMMIAEIVGGWWFNSMALLADGWHMGTHALALGLSLAAYTAARRFSQDRRFNFGTWKIEILGGYTSAIFLVLVALSMAYYSIGRLFSPLPIRYDSAILVAVIGLLVNLLCAWLLGDGHSHSHDDDHDHEADSHPHKHRKVVDLNLRSAYLHVLADAATSICAIAALLGAKYLGADWLDPTMGMAGSLLILIWGYGLTRDTAKILLDAEMDSPLAEVVRKTIAENDPTAVLTDLHLWRVSADRYSCILSLTADDPLDPDTVKRWLEPHDALAHITVEINRR